MSEIPNESITQITQTNFEEITTLVSTEFQTEEALIEHNISTYYLKQPQETKQAFLKLLKNLEPLNLIAILRRRNGRIVLKVIPKPHAKPSNIVINWILFFATIATTFISGYMLSGDLMDPIIGGLTFTIALMTILGLHEAGHKIVANKKGIEATPPYFIPGLPPIGTFGAVIMQKSLPPNKDALFDIGSSGPILSFILATIATAVGLPFSSLYYSAKQVSTIRVPLLFWLIAEALVHVPPGTPDKPLPAAMLDGGHVARSLFSEKTKSILTFFSILLLIVEEFWPMAFFVLFMSMYRHPGPLDDVSSLSKGRKLLTIVLVVILVLSSFFHYLVFYLLELLWF